MTWASPPCPVASGSSRARLGGLVRAVTTTAVKKFARATEQLGALRGKVVTLSLDEHAIARFTLVLDFDRRRPWLRPLLPRFNEAEVVLPRLAGRRVVMGFAARPQRLPDARPVLMKSAELGSGFTESCGGVWR
jgi:hypothetical protein